MTEVAPLDVAVADLAVTPGTAACVWLGQGGFLFKSAGGVTVMVDAYLTDSAEAVWGVRRAIPSPLDPERFAPDLFLVTHWHEDHLDPPLVRHYAAQPNVVFGGPASCVERAVIWGWPRDRTVVIEESGRQRVGDVEVLATFARHDEVIAPTPDAVGFLLDLGGVRVWNVADSEYDARLLAMKGAQIDVMLVPINGGGGNMNAHEAALLVWQVAPKIAIPMHYGMWDDAGYGPGATLDPDLFADTLARLGGATEIRLLELGEVATFARAAD
jgi:L-ascorbate metabolism protein UlaG (beta-lactamase superfamily)